jgi:hypothetical protein
MTMRTVRDLLDLSFIFSQQRLLRVPDFIRDLSDRGVRLDPGHLEAFHHVGALTPVFRLLRDWRTYRDIRALDEYRLPREVPMFPGGMDVGELRAASRAGRLKDAQAEMFRPWSRLKRKLDGANVTAAEYLYSPYQILLAPRLERLVWRTRHRRSTTGNVQYRLRRFDPVFDTWPFADSDLYELVVALSALEARYLPEILGRLTRRDQPWATNWVEEWEDYRDTFDAAGVLAWLGWDASRVQQRAEMLLTVASGFDPLGPWHRVVRHAASDAWIRLKGAARSAIDYRVAAEILLRFYEDLISAGVAPPLPDIPALAPHPLHDRLRDQDDDLDAVLTEFGLSPHPALVIVLEGTTEAHIVPRVMQKLGIPRRRDFIELVNARGVDHDLGALASFVVTPGFSVQHGDHLLLTRPLTQFVVLADAEGKLRTDQVRATKRAEWLRWIADSVWEARRVRITPEIFDPFVSIVTWDSVEAPPERAESFEYAHFTDSELAEGLLAVYWGETQPVRADLERRLALYRREGRNIEKIWTERRLWPSAGGPESSKIVLADALWPVLEAKIDACIGGEKVPVPVVDKLREITALVVGRPRRQIALALTDHGHAPDD